MRSVPPEASAALQILVFLGDRRPPKQVSARAEDLAQGRWQGWPPSGALGGAGTSSCFHVYIAHPSPSS